MNTPHDTPDSASAHPVLSLDEAKRFEAALFGGDESREWPAMQLAGRMIAGAVLRDFCELGAFPENARILVLAGKGHNGGDALIAARCILEKFPRARANVCFVFGERTLRPLAMRAWRDLMHAAPHNVSLAGSAEILLGGRCEAPPKPPGGNPALPESFDLCLDGIFGFQFRPPVDAPVAALIERVNALPVRFRAAVDLPSAQLFRADFTYATGAAKTPALDDNNKNPGRVRYLNLGFFSGTGRQPANVAQAAEPAGSSGTGDSPVRRRAAPPVPSETNHLPVSLETQAASPRPSILTPAILAPLRALRPSHSDKRDYGHLYIIGGSRQYPGAVLMSVIAALRGGAGLVTAFVPESLVPAFAAQVPEAIWCGMAESPGGGLALEDFGILRERLLEKASGTANATALVIGPGLSRDREARALVTEVLRINEKIPVVLDADALQDDIVAAGHAPRILTPHAGEYQRIAAAIPRGAVVVRKGPLTRIERDGNAYFSPFGGPVLARGGSGDLLAGMIGGLLAQRPGEPLLSACRGTVWHGMAADCLARAQGQHAVRTTQVLDYLPEALRKVEADLRAACFHPHLASQQQHQHQRQPWQSAPR